MALALLRRGLGVTSGITICSFWQMYDNLVPLILRKTFHMDESLTGVIMAADNILALFLRLPSPERTKAVSIPAFTPPAISV